MRKKALWIVGFVLLVTTIPGVAQEGIPMGNAVFYPSVELLYSHTDNLYLQDSSEPYGNFGDSYWAIRPNLGFEFPFKESYVRFNLIYQYKEYDKYQLDSKNTWMGDFESRFKFSNDSVLTFREHYINGVQEVSQFDPGYEVTWNNVPFYRNETELAYDFHVSQRNMLGFFATYNDAHFSEEDDRYQPFYDYTQWSGGARWRYDLGAFSSMVFQYEHTDSKPESSWNPGDPYQIYYGDRKYKDDGIRIGWEGSAGSQFSGHADLGYERMRFSDNNFGDYSGLVGDVALHYNFTESLKLDFDIHSRPYQSAYNVNNYFNSTQAQAQLHQQVTRYFFWTAGYLYQRNSYDEEVVADVDGNGLPDDPVSLATQGQKRRDLIGRLYAEVGFHFTRRISVRANYHYEDRDSNIHYVDTLGVYHRPYSYKENRFTIQAQLGW